MPQDSGLRWADSLPPFMGPGSELPDGGYAIEAIADGTNFGNPQAQIEIVKSLLTDGSLAVLEGWDNREAPIRLRLSAPSAIAGPALADAEKALMLAVTARIKAPLVYIPPAQDAVTCVFDVVAAKLERDVANEWDVEEVLREYRYYLLTLTCLPFARTQDTVVVPAIAPDPDPEIPPVVTVIHDCSTFADWSPGFVNATDTSSGSTSGYVYATGRKSPLGQSRLSLTLAQAVAMGTQPLLLIDVETRGNAVYNTALKVTKLGAVTEHTPIGSFASPIAGVRYVYELPDGFDDITAGASISSSTGGLRIHNVQRADKLTSASTTTRQQSRAAFVAGSAPTQAAVRLFDETPAPLGADLLVHTSSNTSWAPNLRRWLVTAGAVPNADAVTGVSNHDAGGLELVYRFPASLLTEGTYALMARMLVYTAEELSWSAKIVDADGTDTVGSSVVVSGSVIPEVSPALGVFTVSSLGAISLPVVAVEGDQMVQLTLTLTGNMTMDEAWLFGMDDGALTWLRDADSLTWLEIRSPELDATRPSVFGGVGAVGNDPSCVDWKCESFGSHRFEPGLIQIFTVTSTSLISQSELEFYPRYHSHVEGTSA